MIPCSAMLYIRFSLSFIPPDAEDDAERRVSGTSPVVDNGEVGG
jgi:hypothetical protein